MAEAHQRDVRDDQDREQGQQHKIGNYKSKSNWRKLRLSYFTVYILIHIGVSIGGLE